MTHAEKISVDLTPELATVIRQVVESGEYASVSEVMREALRDWLFRRTNRQQAIDELRRQWNEGLESGAAEDGEEVFARLKLVPQEGFEPPTPSLRMRCSTS